MTTEKWKEGDYVGLANAPINPLVEVVERRVDHEQGAKNNLVYLVHIRYDIVETEIRLLHKEEQFNVLIRPWQKYDTEVVIMVDGTDTRREFLINNKNYRESLKDAPERFTYEREGWELELGFAGELYQDGHYTLKLNGIIAEDLPEAPKSERPIFDIGRSEIKKNMNGINPHMKFPFIVCGKFMYLVVSHNK